MGWGGCQKIAKNASPNLFTSFEKIYDFQFLLVGTDNEKEKEEKIAER